MDIQEIRNKYGVSQNDAVPTNIAPFKAEMQKLVNKAMAEYQKNKKISRATAKNVYKTYRELTNLSAELSTYCHDLMYMNFGGGIGMGDFYRAMEG